MAEYFKPLRRKSGMMALGWACLLVMVWTRSLDSIESIEFPTGNTQYRIKSFQGKFFCIWWYEDWKQNKPSQYWSTKRILKPRDARKTVANLQVQVDEGRMMATRSLGGGWFISYKIITIPLCVIAAWCLLSKTRSKSSLTSPAPVQERGKTTQYQNETLNASSLVKNHSFVICPELSFAFGRHNHHDG